MRQVLLVLFFPILSLGVSSHTLLGIACPDLPWYARNVWDMEFYDGRLFVGCGNSSNDEPAPNAGPVDIVTYREDMGWESEFTVDEEQIDRFILLGDALVIPGHDSLEGWELGNWYRRNAGDWIKMRNIPNGVHVFDMIEYDGLLFAALGTTGSDTIVTSEDGGYSWKQHEVPWNASTSDADCSREVAYPVGRVYAFFIVAGELFANTRPMICIAGSRRVETLGYNVHWNGSDFEISDIPVFDLTPADRVERGVIYRDVTVYIAGQTVNDQQWSPLGLFAIGADWRVQQLMLGECSRPQDINVFDGRLYVLCNEPVSAGWLITVQSTCDLTVWEATAIAANHATFARSFAVTPHGIYYALGSDHNSPVSESESTGEVWLIGDSLLPACN